MEQLILHLLGDYVTQSDWMARNKAKAILPALCHAMAYSSPFLLIGSPLAVLFIFASHLLMDSYGLARYLVWVRNWVGPGYHPWAECSVTGSHRNMPEWRALWLLIAADNTVHLMCNYAALRWM